MDINLSPERVTSIYHSLAREVFDYFSMDHGYIPPFVIGPWQSPHEVMCRAVASTAFLSRDRKRACEVRLIDVFHPLMYEDEIIVSLIHELAHVVVGLDEQHGPRFKEVNWELGGYVGDIMVIRETSRLPWADEYRFIGAPSLGYL